MGMAAAMAMAAAGGAGRGRRRDPPSIGPVRPLPDRAAAAGPFAEV